MYEVSIAPTFNSALMISNVTIYAGVVLGITPSEEGARDAYVFVACNFRGKKPLDFVHFVFANIKRKRKRKCSEKSIIEFEF